MSADISRRSFLAGSATGVVASAPMPSQGRRKARAGAPNVIMILVDEMRFPMSFPKGINTPEQCLQAHMPNLARLWNRGVKFSNHYTSGTACSSARACLVTGLYPHQNWCLQTRKGKQPGSNGPNAPALQRDFPTYGKIMRSAGYRTPYVGKWHLSNAPLADIEPQAQNPVSKLKFVMTPSPAYPVTPHPQLRTTW